MALPGINGYSAHICQGTSCFCKALTLTALFPEEQCCHIDANIELEKIAESSSSKPAAEKEVVETEPLPSQIMKQEPRSFFQCLFCFR